MSAMGFGQDKIITLGLNDNNVDEKMVRSLPLWRLIRLLSVGRVYAILATFFFLMGSSFAIGYRLRSETAIKQSAGDAYQIERLLEQHNKDIEEKRVLTKKVEFLTRMGRINNTNPVKLEKPGRKSRQDQNQDQQPARELAKFLDNNVGADKDQNGIPDLVVVLGANRNDSRIRFRSEEQSFDIPEKVKNLTRNVSWMKSKSESTPLKILESLPNEQMSPKPSREPFSKPIPLMDPLMENETERPGAIEPLPSSRRLTGRRSNSEINRKEADTSPPTMKCILLPSKRLSSFSHLRA